MSDEETRVIEKVEAEQGVEVATNKRTVVKLAVINNLPKKGVWQFEGGLDWKGKIEIDFDAEDGQIYYKHKGGQGWQNIVSKRQQHGVFVSRSRLWDMKGSSKTLTRCWVLADGTIEGLEYPVSGWAESVHREGVRTIKGTPVSVEWRGKSRPPPRDRQILLPRSISWNITTGYVYNRPIEGLSVNLAERTGTAKRGALSGSLSGFNMANAYRGEFTAQYTLGSDSGSLSARVHADGSADIYVTTKEYTNNWWKGTLTSFEPVKTESAYLQVSLTGQSGGAGYGPAGVSGMNANLYVRHVDAGIERIYPCVLVGGGGGYDPIPISGNLAENFGWAPVILGKPLGDLKGTRLTIKGGGANLVVVSVGPTWGELRVDGEDSEWYWGWFGLSLNIPDVGVRMLWGNVGKHSSQVPYLGT